MSNYIEQIAKAEAMRMISQERNRQIGEEGHTLAHDDGHTDGQLALLAAAYALSSRGQFVTLHASGITQLLDAIEWEVKPKDPIRDLTRAGALILAELERLLRKEG